MRIVLILALLCLVLPSLAAESDDPYGWRANQTVLQIREACRTSPTTTAKTLLTNLNQVLLHRYDKPTAVKLEFKGEQQLEITLMYKGQQYTRFYGGASPSRAIVDLSASCDGVVSDYPELLPQFSSSWSYHEVGSKAAKLGMSAAYRQSRLTLLKKYFKAGDDDLNFKRALRDTIANGVGETNINSAIGVSTIDEIYALGEIRSNLESLPTFDRKRRHDVKELPLAIQAKVANVIKLYWWSMQWYFLSTANAYAG